MAIFHPDRDGCSITTDIDGGPCSILGKWADDPGVNYICTRVFEDNSCGNFFYESAGAAKLMLKAKITGKSSAFSIKAWGIWGYK